MFLYVYCLFSKTKQKKLCALPFLITSGTHKDKIFAEFTTPQSENK